MEDRGRLDSAFRDVVGESGAVRHLVSTAEVEILDIVPSVETEKITKAVRSFLQKEALGGMKVHMTKRSFRESRKAYVLLEEVWALKLLKAAHIKIGWVSCRVGRKMEPNNCYRCLGFGHRATCTRNPWCHHCIAREKPRVDHISGTMRCAAFR